MGILAERSQYYLFGINITPDKVLDSFQMCPLPPRKLGIFGKDT